VSELVEDNRIQVVATGSVKENVEPLPTSLSTQMRPPCSSTILRTMARPNPVLSSPAVAQIVRGHAQQAVLLLIRLFQLGVLSRHLALEVCHLVVQES
jgi:hypothetical protein